MSEMVERVAMAICRINHSDPDYPGLGQEVCPQACGYCEARAKAAIEAMREIPDDVLAEGESFIECYDDLGRAWRAMINMMVDGRDAVRPSTGKAEPPPTFEAAPANVTQLAPKRE
jgi:hypothetical protein